MQIVEKNVKDLIPYAKNPRRNDNAVPKVAESIEKYGFKVPIIIDENGVVVTGHTRLKAAKKLGMETVPCIVADDLTPEQIKAFRLADNKVSEESVWDNKLLLDELSFLGPDIFTGFDLGGVFDDVLDEKDNTPISENESGVIWEFVVKSPNRAKIEKIAEMWEMLGDE